MGNILNKYWYVPWIVFGVGLFFASIESIKNLFGWNAFGGVIQDFQYFVADVFTHNFFIGLMYYMPVFLVAVLLVSFFLIFKHPDKSFKRQSIYLLRILLIIYILSTHSLIYMRSTPSAGDSTMATDPRYRAIYLEKKAERERKQHLKELFFWTAMTVFLSSYYYEKKFLKEKNHD